MRGVTFAVKGEKQKFFISTHTPHARRDLYLPMNNQPWVISTHTPHARRDVVETPVSKNFTSFLLTRLMRGVTGGGRSTAPPKEISTHTPHARRDANCCRQIQKSE